MVLLCLQYMWIKGGFPKLAVHVGKLRVAVFAVGIKIGTAVLAIYVRWATVVFAEQIGKKRDSHDCSTCGIDDAMQFVQGR